MSFVYSDEAAVLLAKSLPHVLRGFSSKHEQDKSDARALAPQLREALGKAKAERSKPILDALSRVPGIIGVESSVAPTFCQVCVSVRGEVDPRLVLEAIKTSGTKLDVHLFINGKFID